MSCSGRVPAQCSVCCSFGKRSLSVLLCSFSGWRTLSLLVKNQFCCCWCLDLGFNKLQPVKLGGSEKQHSRFLGTSAFKIITLGPWQTWQSWGLHRARLSVTKTVHQSAGFRFAQTFPCRWKSKKQICCAVVGTSLPCLSAQVQIEGDFLACSFSILEEQPMDMLLGLDMLKRHQVSKPLLKQLPGS